MYGFGELWFFAILKEKLRDFTRVKLKTEDFVCSAESLGNSDEGKSAIYVLGGTQESLRLKYRLAASLYGGGSAETILVMHQEGITQYASDLGRNLTNREWSERQLANLGVDDENIEFIDIEPGFFGTFSEAGTLAKLSEDKGMNRLFLVCLSYHCKRVEAAFGAFFHDESTIIEICKVDNNTSARGLLFEYGKLIVYENILIPYKKWTDSR